MSLACWLLISWPFFLFGEANGWGSALVHLCVLCAGLGFVAPGSSGSSGGRLGSSQGRSSFAAAAAAGAPAGGGLQQQMRRSHSHQQLAAAVAAAAAEMGGTAQQSYGPLQRYGSSPQTGSSGGTHPGQPGSSGGQQQQQQQTGVSSVSFGGAGGGSAAGAGGRLGAAGAPVSFSAAVAGVRRMGAGSVWPAVARVDSDASQVRVWESLAGELLLCCTVSTQFLSSHQFSSHPCSCPFHTNISSPRHALSLLPQLSVDVDHALNVLPDTADPGLEVRNGYIYYWCLFEPLGLAAGAGSDIESALDQ